jgi:hypothetical protein
MVDQGRMWDDMRLADRGRAIPGQPRPEPGALCRLVIERTTGAGNGTQGSMISGIPDARTSEVVIRDGEEIPF